MKTLESVKNDVFASFADAQMSKEEMKMVKGGGSWTCQHSENLKGSNAVETEAGNTIYEVRNIQDSNEAIRHCEMSYATCLGCYEN